MRILVTGATGTIGRQVVDRLLASEARVRALTRRPDSAGLPSGVEVVGGDLERPETVEPTLVGVDSLYLLAEGDTEQVVELARMAGVRHIVVLSSATAAIEDDANGRHHRAAELAVENSGLAWTHLRPGMFASNLLDWSDAIRTEGVVRAPYDAARQAPVHEADVAEIAAAALLGQGQQGNIYTLSGPESLTKSEQVAEIGRGIGRPLRFEEVSPDQWREQVKDEMPEYVVEWFLGYWATTVDNPEPVLPDVEKVLGRPARTLVEWAADHAAAFR
ncbi:NAD(P)H-binding protein [Micromonospora sp. DT229]|uniref:NAD(P)H-binding protein n=1 Tax=Micromonospora sp. DT229 TaxID=3393430 RepID=UPI003CF91654